MDGCVTDQGTQPSSGEQPTFSEHSEMLTGTFLTNCTIREQLLDVLWAGLAVGGEVLSTFFFLWLCQAD